MASVEGNLASVGVPRLFRAIADERRTGKLSLRDTEGLSATVAEVYFRGGDAYHARLLGSGVQLGTRLVSAGLLTHEEIERALHMQRTEPGSRRIGEILVDEGLVSREDIEIVVRQQIEDTIFEVLRWEDGTWRFEPETISTEDIGLLISVENLVMEAARRFREWHQISRAVPSLEAIPSFSTNESAPVEVALRPDEWALVSRVDGRTTITTLAHACGFTEMEAARTVSGLVEAGLLTLEIPEGVVLPVNDEDLELAFDELETVLEEATRDRSREGQSPITLDQIISEGAAVVLEEGSANGSSTSATLVEAITENIAAPSEEVPASQPDLPMASEDLDTEDDEPDAIADFLVEEDRPAGPEVEENDLPSLAELPVIQETKRAIQTPVDSYTSTLRITYPDPDIQEAEYQPLFGSTQGMEGSSQERSGGVIAEEPAGTDIELTAIAQVFAELAQPHKGPEVTLEEPPTSDEKPASGEPKKAAKRKNSSASSANTAGAKPDSSSDSTSEVEPAELKTKIEAEGLSPSEIPSPLETEEKGSTSQDSEVDLGSLMREFSALQDDHHEGSSISKTRSSKPKPAADKGRGLFGRKRK